MLSPSFKGIINIKIHPLSIFRAQRYEVISKRANFLSRKF
jgi:hypothetical protein